MRNSSIRQKVLSGLARGWSPEQMAGRLARDNGKPMISHETIYRFIYAQIVRTKDYTWRRYLPRGKSKRGWRSRRGGSPASFIAHRRPIHERPEKANDRRTPGHREADLMQFKTYGQTILTLHERRTRPRISSNMHPFNGPAMDHAAFGRNQPNPHIARNFVTRAAEAWKIRARRAKLIFEVWGRIVLKYIRVRISKINSKIPCIRRSQ